MDLKISLKVCNHITGILSLGFPVLILQLACLWAVLFVLQARKYPSTIDPDAEIFKRLDINLPERCISTKSQALAIAYKSSVVPLSWIKPYLERDRIQQAQIRSLRSAAEKREEMMNILMVSFQCV